MSKLFNLVKIDLIHSYSINKLNKKHNPKRKSGSLIATILLSAFLFVTVFIAFFAIGFIAYQSDQLDYLLVFGYTIGSFFVFTTTISKANGFLFESKDFELLMSMPIKTKTIVLSKLISLLLLNYLGFGLVFIPCIIIYGIFSSSGIIYYLLALIAFITGPLLIIAICSFLSYLLGLALKKFKYKSIFMSILSLIVFTVVFILYMTFVNKMEYMDNPTEENLKYMAEYFTNMKSNFMKYYPISKFLSDGLTGNILQYLLYLLLMIAPFSVLVIFVSENFLKANMRAKISYTNKNFKLKKQKQSNKIMSLLKRDMKRFFSSSAQVLNIGIGPIMSTILLVIMAINFGKEVNIQEDEFMKSFMPVMLVLTVGFTYGVMPSTSSSISLEGKNFWIIKTAPIKTKDIFISKILFYVIICLPFVIINTVIMAVLLKLTIINIILALIIQIILIFTYSFEGLWINVLTPKFDWDNEVKAIKQGTGPLLSMLLGFLVGAIMYVPPFIALSFNINGLVVLLCTSSFVLIIMGIILFTHGKSKYEKIQA